LALTAAVAADESINTTDENVAIKGYDTVAYFVENRPMKGKPEFEHVWQGARWHFATAEHREMFAKDPLNYAPRYGGFCSGGMSLGVKATINPEAWAIIDGKLYLAFSERTMKRFTSDPETNIAKADSNWQRIGDVE
jgi:YHS domain-containing protein